jgi:sugar phosphate isomerase/epimerase
MFKNLDPTVLGISGLDSQLIELTLSYGFKGLTLDLAGFAGQVETQGFARASRLITSARLKIGSFRVPELVGQQAGDEPADLEALRRQADLARQMGCTRATTTIQPGSLRRPYHENFEFQRRRIADIAGVLAEFQIRLGIGLLAPDACRADYPYKFIRSSDELLLLLANIGAANVGIALDSWHWHLGGGTLDQLRALAADKIVTVGLAQAEPSATAANATIESRRMPGDDGPIELAGLLALLAERRYDGPVTPEPDKSQLVALGRDQIVKRAGAALDALWKTAGVSAAGKLATAGR